MEPLENAQEMVEIVNAPQSVESFDSSPEDDFEKMLDERERLCTAAKMIPNSNPTISDLAKRKNAFLTALEKIEDFDRSNKLDVMKAIPKFPEVVQAVAYTVTALPTTHVSVERLFSALRIVKSHLRSRMGNDLRDSILFFRTNWSGFQA